MRRSEIIVEDRLEKLHQIKAEGIDPYPAKSARTHTCSEASIAKEGEEVAVVGRVMSIRLHGKAGFIDVVDEFGKIQVYIKLDLVGEKDFEVLKLIDVGDFVQAQGKIFITKTGEPTVNCKKLTLLTKAIKQIPEIKEIKNKEELFRKRYLDLLGNPDTKETFRLRSKFLNEMRKYLTDEAFIEVETPILQTIPGGASAKPFKTYYNEYHIDVYLRVAPELYLKRLIVGGFERVFEVAKCFRNECVDRTHNPEFTQIEFYVAYMDYNALMEFTEKMLRTVVKNVKGNYIIEKDGHKVDFEKPFGRMTFAEATDGKMTDQAFKEKVKSIIQPTFITDHPLEISPLAKKKDEKTAQRFQLVVAGMELINAYSELNDPIDQKERFLEQAKLLKAGDEEAQRMDEDFIEALEYGMPPTAGWGMGIDRFVTLLNDKHTLREAILFPFMKPRG